MRTKYDICIVGGCGHVGLPLALVFASKGLKVLIYDINETSLKTISKGIMPFIEHDAENLLKDALDKELLFFSSKAEEIAQTNTVIITVGTPVDEFLNPIHSAIKKCFEPLIPHLSDGAHIVLRSTVFPGTTEWLDKYLQDMGLKVQISFCPERIVQGFAVKELQSLPQIISATTDEALKAAELLFGKISPKLVKLSPTEAEFAKLFSNAYRYIQFATTNQFFMMANNAGINYHKVLEGIKKDYSRAQDLPSPGFAAGPCLFKDTMQLAAFANNQFSLGHAAMLVNEGLALYMVEEIQKHYNLDKIKVGLLGMAFKADSDDIRASLSYKLKKLLEFRVKELFTTDPYVSVDPNLMPLDEVVEKSDLLILCVPHKMYKNIDIKNKPLVDVWGLISKNFIS